VALIDDNQLRNLRDLAAGDDSFLISIIEAFLPQLVSVPGALREAFATGEARTVAELAHSLKGSAANIGAEDVARLCLAIEHRARNGDLETAAAATRRAFEAERARLT
jgi:HPt (histidine-containing phosphotransfer) domain-containing protein